MLVVKVELWPGGNETDARELGRAGLANISHLSELSDYLVVRFDDSATTQAGKLHRHHRGAGFWPLLARAAAADDWAQLTDHEAEVAEAMLATIRPAS